LKLIPNNCRIKNPININHSNINSSDGKIVYNSKCIPLKRLTTESTRFGYDSLALWYLQQGVKGSGLLYFEGLMNYCHKLINCLLFNNCSLLLFNDEKIPLFNDEILDNKMIPRSINQQLCMTAARYGHKELFLNLINLKDEYLLMQCTYLSAKYGHIDIFKFLLQHYNHYCDVDVTNYACDGKHIEIMDHLMLVLKKFQAEKNNIKNSI
jgi:hypothetical protein